MSITSSLLCPIDFSSSSRGALRYALAIARRFDSRLTVMTVDEPLLAEVGNTRMGEGWSTANSERELRSFVEELRSGTSHIRSVSKEGQPDAGAG